MQAPGNLLPCDGEMRFYPGALPPERAGHLFAALLNGIQWRQETATLFGRKMPVPRLVAWQGERSYAYSGIVHDPAPWTPELTEIKRIAERVAATPFNSVLLNLYRDGRDSMGWHADDESELGPEPVIASVSLGAERIFQVRHRRDKSLTYKLPLPHGSCLVMAGVMQENWLHQIAKTTRCREPRINLTFRRIM